ncbi:hypothetical protein [Sinorhizobium meliloti]|uniref:hypothetical protein n=1 Tax=Rhizobium meliloti TaxID=382 RepID=UPI0013E3E08E|nr:hypothetical protein [Sinorhizobium meliloti]
MTENICRFVCKRLLQGVRRDLPIAPASSNFRLSSLSTHASLEHFQDTVFRPGTRSVK